MDKKYIYIENFNKCIQVRASYKNIKIVDNGGVRAVKSTVEISKFLIFEQLESISDHSKVF